MVEPRQLRELREIVGDEHVLVDEDLLSSYVVDFTGRFRGWSGCVVRPGSTQEVAAIVSTCRRNGIRLTVQGGNTGLVGGAVPLGGETVLSLRRLSRIDHVDPRSGQLTAGAGVSIVAVQQAAAAAGWAYGVDFSSRASATVGGSVATNAGGLRVLRHGDTRAQLLGVEAVLGTAAVVSRLSGLTKDNTGYHLPGLLCGSEGTLGVVTAARFRLVAPLAQRVVALLAFRTPSDAVAAAGSLRRQLPSLSAAELFFDEGLSLVREVLSLPTPFPSRHRAYLLLEAGADHDPVTELSAAVESLHGVEAVAVATGGHGADQLWRYREGHTEAINTLGAPHKLDVTVPMDAFAELVERVPEVVARLRPEARTWLFGHAAEGSLHVNVTGVDPADEEVDEAVLRLVASLEGSISAEHGIGRAKRRWLDLCRSSAEIEAFRAIKGALDPDGILNPGVLLPDS